MNNTHTNPDTDISQTLGLDASPVGTRRLKRWLIWFGLILLIAASVLKWGTHTTTVAVKYKTQPVQMGNMTITVSATGNLEPTNQVDVGSEQSGTIK
ncbi:MAG: efflux RND transporter periplasmic adaptor subunit, partial [Ketobacter sp.]|nr:efflux RND transporter periplasmic adaptor subunit [Ketobacter sp.]